MLLRNTMILRPYVRPLKRIPNIAVHTLAYAGLVLFSLIYGYAITILPTEMLFIPATPLMILIGLILWALPDTNRVPRSITVGLLGFFLASNYIWPAYVAVNLPGLPWLNPQRVALSLLLILSLYGFAISSRMRNETLEVARAEPMIWKSFMVFWICTLVALPLSGSYFTFSINKWLNNQVYWTFLFFITAYLLQKKGGMITLAKALMIAAIVTSLIAIPEYIGRRVPWVGYVPSWLIGDPIIYERVSSDQARLNLDMYRARSSFTVSLSFAEFLSLAFPFILHSMMEDKNLVKKIVFAAAAVLVATAMAFLTNARSGTNGLIIGLFGYALFWTIRRWLKKRNDLIAPAAILAFPAAVAAFGVLVLAWRRLYVMVVGGGQHQFSNDAREVQWGLAMDRLMVNPIGYGPGRTAEIIGYTNRGGEVTIDSYYINLLIDSGIIGFLAFFVLVISTVLVALRMAMTTDDKETLLAGPLAIALVALLVIKSVLSQPENLPVLFIFAGAVSALAWRTRKAAADQPAPALTGFSRTQNSLA